jgi:Ca2+-binding RTX toxin-like protein
MLTTYAAFAAPVLPALRLDVRSPDVVSLGNGTGDKIIDLGSRTFTINGQQYGGQLHVSWTGSLSFGDGQPSIQVLEDSHTLPLGVFYAFRDETGDGVADLIVDFQGDDGAHSYYNQDQRNLQAVLELNTGSRSGTMLFNYINLNIPDTPRNASAREATIGLTDPTTSPATQFIAYQNATGDIGVRGGMSLLIRGMDQDRPLEQMAGTMHVFGSPGFDRMSLSYASGTYHAVRNAQALDFAALPFRGVYLHGYSGDDVITVNSIAAGDVVGIDGNEGTDTLLMNSRSAASLFGGVGNDTLQGNRYGDQMEGGPGNDVLTGGAGNDAYFFAGKTTGQEVDTVDERAGEGQDRIDFAMLRATQPSVIDLRSDKWLGSGAGRRVTTASPGEAENFEDAAGGGGNDTLIGNGGSNVLQGYSGNDVLHGNNGNDVLDGGYGSDKLYGDAGDDTYRFINVGTYGPAESDTLTEEPDAGNDALDFSGLFSPLYNTVPGAQVFLYPTPDGHLAVTAGRTILGSGAHIERVTGSQLADQIYGNARDNVLVGNGGDDLLVGGAGNDLLYGGLGNDTYKFGNASGEEADTLFEAASAGSDALDFAWLTPDVPVVVHLGNSLLASHAGRHVWRGTPGTSIERAYGGRGNDTLNGTSGRNLLYGMAGNDVLNGGGGDDFLSGSDGDDVLNGGAGSDSAHGGNGYDRYVFATAIGQENDIINDQDSTASNLLDFSLLAADDPVSVDLSQRQLASHRGRTVSLGWKYTSPLSFRDATGGAGDDTLIGNIRDNRLVGGPGNDTLQGGGGNDDLVQ